MQTWRQRCSRRDRTSGPCRSWSMHASPCWNFAFVRPCSCARLFAASTRFLAISTPSTSAPSLAAGSAVVPSPHPISSTLWPGAIPIPLTSASPLPRMLCAMRVKSPFSHNAWFGVISAPSSGDLRSLHWIYAINGADGKSQASPVGEFRGSMRHGRCNGSRRARTPDRPQSEAAAWAVDIFPFPKHSETG